MSEKVPDDVSLYEKHYSESSFWSKVKKVGIKVLEPALTLYYVMKSPNTPMDIKIKIGGTLGYLILPIDLVPDAIPVAGYADDLIALLKVVKMCRDYITPEIEAQVNAKLNEM